MPRAYNFSEGGPVSEMAIVDTFTKLIFGDAEHYSDAETLIIQALRAADANLAHDASADMGEYLRALEVGEMIELVARVREQLAQGLQIVMEQAPGNRLDDRLS